MVERRAAGLTRMLRVSFLIAFSAHKYFQLTAIIGIADPGAVELTDDEVQALFEKFGFTIEHREANISASYIQDPRSMLQNTYKATHWVARKQ